MSWVLKGGVSWFRSKAVRNVLRTNWAWQEAACAKRGDILDVLKRHGGYGLCEKKQSGDGYQKKSMDRCFAKSVVGLTHPSGHSEHASKCMDARFQHFERRAGVHVRRRKRPATERREGTAAAAGALSI